MYASELSTGGLAWGIPERYDVAVNFLRTGGRHSAREPYSTLVSRVTYFRTTFVKVGAGGERVVSAPGSEELLDLPELRESAARLYFGDDAEALSRAVVEPSVVYANLLVPGMELGVHVDVPEFRGLTREHVPQWLLVAMHLSGLFERYRVRIATTVSWWSRTGGGKFVFYPHGQSGAAREHHTRFGSAVMIDTDTVFHGVDRVAPRPDSPAPTLDTMPPIAPGMKLVLQDGGTGGDAELWSVVDPAAGGAVVANFTWGDVRLSISWKGYVFADAAERDAWRDHTDDLTVEEAVRTLVADLKARGKLPASYPDQPEPSHSLGTTIAAEYIRFPPPTAPWQPRHGLGPFRAFNYCLLPVVNVFCGAKSPLDIPPVLDPLSVVRRGADAA